MIYDFRNRRFIENSEGNIRYFNNSHGGHAEEHRREMEEIAHSVFKESYTMIMKEIEDMVYAA